MENPNPNPNPNPIGLSIISSSSRTNYIEFLYDELLIEIFIRLACYETVITCRLVSKRWLSLLSNPKFLIRFVNHKRNNPNPLPWTFLTTLRLKQPQPQPPEEEESQEEESQEEWLKSQTLIDNHNKVFSTPTNKYSLNFLPGGGEGEKYIIAATYKDLVLVYKGVNHSEGEPRYYYICNPVTKRWLALPPTPSPIRYYSVKGYDYYWVKEYDYAEACLICEDPYAEDDDYLLYKYRFRVIVVITPRAEELMDVNRSSCIFNMMVFCSQNNDNNYKWVEVQVNVSRDPNEQPYQRTTLQLVLCKELRLLCFRCHHYFGMLDAFFDTTRVRLEARALPLPPSSFWPKSFLLECRGRLISVYSQYTSLSPCLQVFCAVLDLNKHNQRGGVELRWKECCRKCIDKTTRSGDRSSSCSGIRLINIHPTNPQLFYCLTTDQELLQCDIGSGSGSGSPCIKTLGQCCESLGSEHFHRQSPFFKTLELQYWPTPLPTVHLPST